MANCGDSRAVLCRAGTAVALSHDHKVILSIRSKEHVHVGTWILILS